MANLLHNDTVARALSRAVADGDVALGTVPGLLRRVITENMWQERILPETGLPITFSRFEDFVMADPLEGLGTTMDVIKSLCKRDPDVLALIEQVTKKESNSNGGNRNSIIHNTDSPSHQDTSREYTVARLERDGHSALAQQVINREITAAEARRQAGWETKRRAIQMDNAESAAQTILKYMEPDVIEDLLQLLQEAIAEKV